MGADICCATEGDMMRLYIAGPSSDLDRANAATAAARAAGIDVVSTWPQIIAEVGDGNPRDATDEQRAGWAVRDLAELACADAVLLLVPATGSCSHGAFLELGYALGLGDKIAAAAGDCTRSVFCALVEEFDTDEEAIGWLAGFSDDELESSA